jgi:hypothetical protein
MFWKKPSPSLRPVLISVKLKITLTRGVQAGGHRLAQFASNINFNEVKILRLSQIKAYLWVDKIFSNFFA